MLKRPKDVVICYECQYKKTFQKKMRKSYRGISYKADKIRFLKYQLEKGWQKEIIEIAKTQ